MIRFGVEICEIGSSASLRSTGTICHHHRALNSVASVPSSYGGTHWVQAGKLLATSTEFLSVASFLPRGERELERVPRSGALRIFARIMSVFGHPSAAIVRWADYPQ